MTHSVAATSEHADARQPFAATDALPLLLGLAITLAVRGYEFGNGNHAIYLIAPVDDDSPFAEFLAEGGPGLHHIAYGVPDLDAALAALREAGRELLDDEPRTGPGGTRIAFVSPEATYGVLIQLIERPS